MPINNGYKFGQEEETYNIVAVRSQVVDSRVHLVMQVIWPAQAGLVLVAGPFRVRAAPPSNNGRKTTPPSVKLLPLP